MPEPTVKLSGGGGDIFADLHGGPALCVFRDVKSWKTVMSTRLNDDDEFACEQESATRVPRQQEGRSANFDCWSSFVLARFSFSP